ncbi:TetR/AcrR family transcriptional regulator [Antrihabitans stalactiti]|uniref:TetR/AcrR family transcriptional regulator n=1 Tax=Antrihabitans stalactiti TaxID=2584121 RepID=A0A848KDK9_9NOCA|nr:TetR/AcrR family transcriptional regulator [Antrihabitans stalactiti]
MSVDEQRARAGADASKPRRALGRPAIPRERIVATALQIVDEEGPDALSMRTLAQRLESGTATLYRHFSDRSELVAEVVDLMFADVDIEAIDVDGLVWQDAARGLARAMFENFAKHRHAASLLADTVPIGPHALEVREKCLELLLANGFPVELAARAYVALARHVVGFAIQLRNVPAEQIDAALLSTFFHTLDPAAFQATHAVADFLPASLEEEFAFGLDLLIDGLVSLHDRHVQGVTPARD